MKFSHVLLIVAIALAAGFGGAKLAAKNNPAQTTKVETAYERVMRTKTLRCGWFAEPPFTSFDANSGARSGIVPDIVTRVATDYELKVEWETISNFALMGEDLKQGKYDAICASLINMPRGGLIDPVDAFAYVPLYGYVRNNENRLTQLSQLNDPAYRIAVQEGAAVTAVTKQKFPQAQPHVIPSAELAEMFTSVVDNKADVAFAIPTFYDDFNKTNPNALKPLDTEHPLQLFAFAFGVKPQEDGLKSLFNNSLHRIIVSGDLGVIFATHNPSGTLKYPTLSMSGQK